MSSSESLANALAGNLAFVDLETTGCDPARDRIIEIAVAAVDDGHLVDQWSTLVNPGTRIAGTITGLTGIDDDMVADAPSFSGVREEVLERLRGRVLVAHNARFDYGFLRNAFRREGIGFRAPVLCTLRLARNLFPSLGRHGLDHLIRHFDLECPARHRALGDTIATYGFVRRAVDELGSEPVAAAIARQRKVPTLPAGLADGALDDLPSGPGVYLFYGRDDVLLYVGKSTDLQRRVMDHFGGDHRTRRAAELAASTQRVEWIETAGELGALLREADLVKRLQPLHNRRLRRHADPVVAILRRGPDGFHEIGLASASDPDAWAGNQCHGPFGDRRAAQRFLRSLVRDHGLCARRLGLEQGRGERPCFARQLGRCRGACTGEEAPVQFNLRLMEALESRRISTWPWNGPVAIPEADPVSGREETHIVDRWRYLGTARDHQEVHAILESGSAGTFDRDHYRVLRPSLDRHPASPRPIAAAAHHAMSP